MCGRFAFWADKKTILKHFQLAAAPDFRSSYNITPGSSIPVILLEETRRLVNCQWGLIPHWAADTRVKPINARAETLGEKPFFREAFRRRRCLIPANGFYEWTGVKGNKQAVFIRSASDGLLAFAGLWDSCLIEDRELLSCTIITTQANRVMERIHDRMPAIISPVDYSQWLEQGGAGLLRPCREALRAYPVSSQVNHTANDSEDLIRPLDSQGTAPPG